MSRDVNMVGGALGISCLVTFSGVMPVYGESSESHHFMAKPHGATVTELIFGGSKIIAHGDCSHEIKRHLLLGRKAVTNVENILKSRDITLPIKVHLVKAYGFSNSHVWM